MKPLLPYFAFLSLALCTSPLPAKASPPGEEIYQEARRTLAGEGAPKDPQAAYEKMKAAAALGNADAIGTLGYFYSTGAGGAPKDEAQAIAQFRKGAELGSARAMYNLGRALIAGQTQPITPEEDGVAWVRKAAETGLPVAMRELAQFYFHGMNAPQDDKLAYTWGVKAADADDADAQKLVGYLLSRGRGVKKDKAAAEQWLRKAANAGNTKAQSNLGHLLGPTDGSDPKRQQEAIRWLLVAESKREVTAIKTLQEIRPALPPELVAAAQRDASALLLQQRVSR